MRLGHFLFQCSISVVLQAGLSIHYLIASGAKFSFKGFELNVEKHRFDKVSSLEVNQTEKDGLGSGGQIRGTHYICATLGF